MSALLQAIDLRKSFGDRPVLRGVSVEIAAHEVVAVIGASGSGKSTLLRCLNLLETIDDGQILLGGEDISDPRVDANRVRARFGAVFQSYNLFPHLSVLDNVTLSLRYVHKVSRAAAEERGLALLERVGLADKAREHPDRLSGGQQQRAAIVRAIATDPEILLLDEITSALDPELVGEVLELVRELADEGSHDPDGHARDGVRARCRAPGGVPGRRADPRAGSAGGGLRASSRGADQGVPGALPRLTVRRRS